MGQLSETESDMSGQLSAAAHIPFRAVYHQRLPLGAGGQLSSSISDTIFWTAS